MSISGSAVCGATCTLIFDRVVSDEWLTDLLRHCAN